MSAPGNYWGQTPPFRAWINQPSTLQPLHHMHGMRGIVTNITDLTATIYFVEGPTVSMVVPKVCISPSC
jgi:hypothetical protein